MRKPSREFRRDRPVKEPALLTKRLVGGGFTVVAGSFAAWQYASGYASLALGTGVLALLWAWRTLRARDED